MEKEGEEAAVEKVGGASVALVFELLFFSETTGGGFGLVIDSAVIAVGACDSLTTSVVVVPVEGRGLATAEAC